MRLMTMHGSKGLEFPIVVLANLAVARSTTGAGTRRGAPAASTSGSEAAAAALGHFATPGYEERWDQEEAAQDAERIRLLYVAATRARDHLIVPALQRQGSPGVLAAVAASPCYPRTPGMRSRSTDVWLLDAERHRAAADRRSKRRKPRRRIDPRSSSEREVLVRQRARKSSSEARKELELTVASSVERSVAAARRRGVTLRVSAARLRGTAAPDRRRASPRDGAGLAARRGGS